MTLYWLEPEVPGGLGPDSVLDTSVHPPVDHHLSLVLLPGGHGDDLAECFPCFAVTERLACAIDASGLTGARWGQIDVQLDEQFAAVLPEQAAALPRVWRRLLADDNPTADLQITDRSDLIVSGAALSLLQQFRLEGCEIHERD